MGFTLVTVFIAYQAYMAVHPNNSFYLAEYQTALDRPPPTEIQVLFADASHPDFHGDYCSFSMIGIEHKIIQKTAAST
ncbi:MAG: hypothetical protein AB1899_06175 [Pseudomonadota bacterium]